MFSIFCNVIAMHLNIIMAAVNGVLGWWMEMELEWFENFILSVIFMHDKVAIKVFNVDPDRVWEILYLDIGNLTILGFEGQCVKRLKHFLLFFCTTCNEEPLSRYISWEIILRHRADNILLVEWEIDGTLALSIHAQVIVPVVSSEHIVNFFFIWRIVKAMCVSLDFLSDLILSFCGRAAYLARSYQYY